MSLIEAYCYINRVNRMRNVELISPEDLLNSCKRFDDLNLPIRFVHSFIRAIISISLYL